MKHSDSTEMDRLLRRHARRNNKALPFGSGKGNDLQDSSVGAHLDADELNTYAEGALPEAARSRYIVHLADCDTCRKLVTDLTLAAGVVAESKVRVAATPVSPSRSWRDWLSAIFSPPVLRYGFPALALLAVIVVAIVALRTQREDSFVARNDQDAGNTVSQSTSNSNRLMETSANTAAASHSNSNAATVYDQTTQTSQPLPSATPLAAKTAPVDDSPAAPVLADKTARGQTAPADTGAGEFGAANKRAPEAETTSTLPAPPAQTKAEAGADEKRRDSAQDTAKAAKEKDNVPAGTSSAGGVFQNTPAVNEDRVGRARTEARKTQELPATARKPSAAPKRQSEREISEEQKLSVETRSVGGRRFRRQGSVWVDTAYNSSRPTINVARGSEQYRGLVADEPTLRTITQQLSGEVIVVWKSSAYRFY
ncbi:MAG TPA: hypothetical protein VF791_14770 [Pyrinomonadaceae bacterium]